MRYWKIKFLLRVGLVRSVAHQMGIVVQVRYANSFEREVLRRHAQVIHIHRSHRSDDFQCPFERHTKILIRPTGVQIHFENPSLSVIRQCANQPIALDVNEAGFEREYEVIAIESEYPTLRH